MNSVGNHRTVISVLKIAICDDEISICNQLEDTLDKISKTFLKELEWDVFYSGEELCTHLYKDNYYDLIFLDIELKKMNGVAVGQVIRENLLNETTKIVYISGKETYALELFKVRPFDFVIKPFDYDKIEKVIKTVLRVTQREYTTFQYTVHYKTYSISTRDILYFESRNRKITMHKTKGTAEFYGKLEDIHKKLQKFKFIQIHKSYLVNYNHIIKLEYNQVTLSNKKILPISQSNRSRIRKVYIELEGEKIWD